MKNYAKVGATGLSTDSTDYRIRISGLRFFFLLPERILLEQE